MEEDAVLLEQEEAFRKLNAELELRTRKLMKEVEEAINKHDTPIAFRSTSYASLSKPSIENELDVRLRDSDSDSDPTFSIGPEVRKPRSRRRSSKPNFSNWERSTSHSRLDGVDGSDVIPEAAKGLSTQGLIRFLKAKVRLLQQELSTLQSDYTIKADILKKTQNEFRTSEEEKNRTFSDVASLRDKLKKQETLNFTLQEKLHIRDTENASMKKEIEQLKQELKKLTIVSNGTEVKLNSAREEVEKLRAELKKSELNEKDTRDKCRGKTDEQMATIRKLEKHKSQLVTAFKKQMQLIDNLKRQKALLQSNQALNHTEEEFLKLLDWSPEDKNKI